MLIASRYRLDEMIGEGGMARIWSGRDLTLDRPVAVKFLFIRENRDRQTMIDRFLREARIAAAVRHPNVVDVLDFGTTDEGRPFMVMERLVGESLKDRIGRKPPLTTEELVRIASEALDGLTAVHKAGIVHRDLKPENLFMLDRDGDRRTKLVDFGVSRDTDPSSGRRSALTTGDGTLVGTPEYMAPEQARGLKDIDWRADIYGMGVTLYEILTGRLPYESAAIGDLIIEVVQGGAPTVASLCPEAGEAMSAVIAKAMSVSREARFESAPEMKRALVAAAGMTLEAASPLDGEDLALPWGPPDHREHAVPALGLAPTAADDEDGLPWGAGAVPSITVGRQMDAELEAGASERFGRGPRSWVVDTALPTHTPPWRWVALALLVPLAGLGTWFLLAEPTSPGEAGPRISNERPPRVDPPDGRPTEARPPEANPPEANPPEANPPEANPPEANPPEANPPEAEARSISPPATPSSQAEVTIRLRGLAPNARVRIDDGELVDVENGVVRIPRDSADHVLTVRAPGHRTWHATHRADSDGDYRVQMPRRPRSADPENGNGNGSGSGSGVFRDLDY